MYFKAVSLFFIVSFVSSQVLPPSGLRRVSPGPTVVTPSGSFQGQEETYDIFRRIITFKGIRYGQAPVGNLRFRQALPAARLASTQQAWEFGSRCPQFTLLSQRLIGEEDCLFLNIATPTRIRSRLPVLFLIHGGGLQFGGGESDLLGPELIIQENVITVALNYRLNVLGFLSTADQHSPGNYAIKDIILALQWVSRNIESFGGDPNDITISGSSGGAVAAHALVVSRAAAGLFHKAIISSGNLFSAWAFQRNPEVQVRNLANNLGLFYRNNEELMVQLRQVSIVRLMNAAGGLHSSTHIMFSPMDFITSLDPVDSLEPRIFTAPIDDLIRSGNINQVPLLTGHTSDENLFTANDNPLILERFNANPNLLIPPHWNITPNSLEANEVITAFRNLYFRGNRNITVDLALEWSHYCSDRDFNFGMSRMIRLQWNRQSIYSYKFSYVGALNLFRRFLRIGDDLPGAVHGDDALYVYRVNRFVLPISSSDEAFVVQRKCVRMWTNFIKFNNPTPTTLDPLLRGVTWSKVSENKEFLDIDGPLTNGRYPLKERMEVWHNFDDKFST